MNIIRQTRNQFFYKPSGKVKNIRAWELLIQHAIACRYRKPLEDRSIAGLRHCIRAWLTMNQVEFIDDGAVILVDGQYAVETLGTHRTKGVKSSTYRGNFDLVKIYCLWDFLTWFDKTFTIDF